MVRKEKVEEEQTQSQINDEDKKNNDNISSEEVSTCNETSLVIPPDGGWGWVVVLASFTCNLILDGIIYSFGMFLNAISENLYVDTASVSIIGSLLSGFYLMAGPFVSVLANKFGFRSVTIVGSILSSLCFLTASMFPNIWCLYIFYGVCGGISFGLIYITSIVTVGFYFEKWRAVAIGIAVCGSGIGTFIFAPLTKILIDLYGWRGTLMIQAGILLICGVCGLAFKPVEPTKITIKESKEKQDDLNEDGLKKDGKQISSISINKIPNRFSMYDNLKVNQGVKNEVRYLSKSEMYLHQNKEQLDPLIVKQEFQIIKQKLIERNDDPESKKFLTPYLRDDMFFSGSLNHLPEYKSQTSLAYHVTVTNQVTRNENVIWKTFKKIFDVSLLSSPSFLLLAFSGFLTMMGFFTPFMYITVRATSSGMDENSAMWLVSIIGITNTVGRILGGVLSSLPGSNALLINNIALTVSGLATIFSSVSLSVPYQYTYAAIFGFSVSAFASLRSVIAVDLVGLEKLTSSFGLLLLFQGIAGTIGAPLCGAIIEVTGSFEIAFYTAGGLILFSGILCYPINFINKWEKRKQQTT